MIEYDAQQPGNPQYLESNKTEEGSEPVEEPDQRKQEILVERELRNERIRLLSIGIALFAIVLSCLLWLFSRAVLPLFVTILVAYPGYGLANAWFNRLNHAVS